MFDKHNYLYNLNHIVVSPFSFTETTKPFLIQIWIFLLLPISAQELCIWFFIDSYIPDIDFISGQAIDIINICQARKMSSLTIDDDSLFLEGKTHKSSLLAILLLLLLFCITGVINPTTINKDESITIGYSLFFCKSN